MRFLTASFILLMLGSILLAQTATTPPSSTAAAPELACEVLKLSETLFELVMISNTVVTGGWSNAAVRARRYER